MATLTYRSLDIMKWTKDNLRDMAGQSTMSALLATIQRYFPNLTHVGVSVPLNASSEYASWCSVGGWPSLFPGGGIAPALDCCLGSMSPWGSVEAYTAAWANTVHGAGYKVLWRNTFNEFEHGSGGTTTSGTNYDAGNYGFPWWVVGDAANNNNGCGVQTPQWWLNKVSEAISRLASFGCFHSGDILAILAEPQSSQNPSDPKFNVFQTSDQSTWTTYFQQIKSLCDSALTNAGIFGVHTGFTSDNGSMFLNGYYPEAWCQISGNIVTDHYGSDGCGGNVSGSVAEMQCGLTNMNTIYGLPIFLQEWAPTINPSLEANPTFLTSFYGMLQTLVDSGKMDGFNYWGGWTSGMGTDEPIFNNDLTLNANGQPLVPLLSPSIVGGTQNATGAAGGRASVTGLLSGGSTRLTGSVSARGTAVATIRGGSGNIQLDTLQTSSGSSSPIFFALTVANNSNRALIIAITAHQGTITSCTYGGANLTQIVNANTTFNETAQLWYMSNPPVGTANVQVVFATASFCAVGAYSLYSVAGSGEPSAFTSAVDSVGSATSSLTVTGVNANSWVIDAIMAEDALTATSSQTVDWSLVGQSFENGMGTHTIRQGTSGNVSMNYLLASGQRWAQAAIVLDPTTQNSSLTAAAKGGVSTSATLTVRGGTTTTVPPSALAIGTNRSSPSSLALQWIASSSAGAIYNVYRGTAPGGEGGTPLATGIGAPTYSDTTVQPGVEYYYTVTAVANGTESTATNEATLPPASPPTNIVATVAGNTVTLTWTASASLGAVYAIYRGTTPNGETFLQANISETTYIDRNLTPATYYYKLTAIV